MTNLANTKEVRARPYDAQMNKHQRISPIGAMIVEQTTRLVGGGFTSTIDSIAWTATNSGAGSASGTASSMATVTSGTANNGYGLITSGGKSRFLYASANVFRGTFRLNATGGSGTTRAWGAFNPGVSPAIQDGFYFGYDGTTSTLSVNVCAGGVETKVSSGSFNGEVGSFTLDANAHNWEIVYQVAGCWFFVDGVLLHSLNPSTSFMSGDMSLYVAMQSSNSASGTTSASMEAWAGSIVRLGSAPPAPQFVNINANGTTVCKRGSGTLHRIALNTAGGNTNILTLYNNTEASGEIIGTVKNVLGSIGNIDYALDFDIGLTVALATGAAGDFTIIFD